MAVDSNAGTARRGIPEPGTIFDPAARALDVIGDRWTLVLVRQLLSGARGFQELRQCTGIAPRVLSGRLRELATKGFVCSVDQGPRSAYALTEEGRSLEPVVVSLGRWWIRRGLELLGIDARRFTETSARSVLEALPFMLREDRARERTHRRLMRLYYLAGDRTGALRQYERCAAALRQELDVEPSRRTSELERRIRRDDPGLAVAAGAGTAGAEEVLERLVELQKRASLEPAQVGPHAYLVTVGEEARRAGLKLAERLRDAVPGLRIEAHCGGGGFRAQMRKADRSSADWAIILGAEEVSGGRAGLKPLRREGQQETLGWEELGARLGQWLAPRQAAYS